MQVDLLVWVNTYKNIYEMDSENRPTADILDDDRRLDLYLEDLQRRRKS